MPQLALPQRKLLHNPSMVTPTPKVSLGGKGLEPHRSGNGAEERRAGDSKGVAGTNSRLWKTPVKHQQLHFYLTLLIRGLHWKKGPESPKIPAPESCPWGFSGLAFPPHGLPPAPEVTAAADPRQHPTPTPKHTPAAVECSFFLKN